MPWEKGRRACELVTLLISGWLLGDVGESLAERAGDRFISFRSDWENTMSSHTGVISCTQRQSRRVVVSPRVLILTTSPSLVARQQAPR